MFFSWVFVLGVLFEVLERYGD